MLFCLLNFFSTSEKTLEKTYSKIKILSRLTSPTRNDIRQCHKHPYFYITINDREHLIIFFQDKISFFSKDKYIYVYLFVTLKVMLPILLKPDADVMVAASQNRFTIKIFFTLQQIAALWQSGKIAFDMIVLGKQRCVIEFVNSQKYAH